MSKWIQKPPPGTPLLPGHPQLDGLVGWYLFQEGMGDKVYDLSGNGNTGALNNFAFPSTPTSGWNPGRIGRTLVYDGSNDYVNMGNVFGFERTDPFSFSFWMKQSISSNDVFLTKFSLSTFNGFLLNIIGDKLECSLMGSFLGGDFIQVREVVQSIFPGGWYHIVVTYDGSSSASGAKIYVDSISRTLTILKDTLTISMVNSVDFEIGSSILTTFEGYIDDFRIYNRALTQSEIVDIMVNPFASFLLPDIQTFYLTPALRRFNIYGLGNRYPIKSLGNRYRIYSLPNRYHIKSA